MTETSRTWYAVEKAVHTVPARPACGLWTPVLDYVSAPVILRVTANGKWMPIEGFPSCGPSGHDHWAFGRDGLLTKNVPLGALIGKIGGSDIDRDEAEIFAVGAQTVLSIDKKQGPLYLTINDSPTAFNDNSGELTITIERAG